MSPKLHAIISGFRRELAEIRQELDSTRLELGEARCEIAEVRTIMRLALSNEESISGED
jgi:hypothetical protein